MATYYDRYEKFRNNASIEQIPGIIITPEATDKQITYKVGSSRMDIISQEYYGNPYHGWLIMMANPQWSGMEFDIPDGEIIRIPFPFTNALERYILGVNRYKELYG
jgi:hypothetical protein